MNDLPSNILKSFAKIQEGMELYLRYEMKNRNISIDQEAIQYTFRHLISAEPLPEAKETICLKMIEVLKDEKYIIDTFKNAMRIKTMLVGKSGMMMKGMNLRMNLLNLGIQISEDKAELPDLNSFSTSTEQFYEYCKNNYLK